MKAPFKITPVAEITSSASVMNLYGGKITEPWLIEVLMYAMNARLRRAILLEIHRGFGHPDSERENFDTQNRIGLENFF